MVLEKSKAFLYLEIVAPQRSTSFTQNTKHCSVAIGVALWPENICKELAAILHPVACFCITITVESVIYFEFVHKYHLGLKEFLINVLLTAI